jgi:hypothetical protein
VLTLESQFVLMITLYVGRYIGEERQFVFHHALEKVSKVAFGVVAALIQVFEDERGQNTEFSLFPAKES